MSGRYGATGYEISEDEFARLLDDAAARRKILRAFSSWGLTVDRADPASIAAAHSTVQADPVRQRAIYQIAMDLWR
jgi:hypothetical protein